MNVNLRPFTASIPWWGKIAAKLILARLPVDYKVWKRLHLFECGKMEDAGYAYGVFKRHFDAARSRRAFNKFVGLELGPGDSLFSAMIAYAYEASAYHLVDVGDLPNLIRDAMANGKFSCGAGIVDDKY